MILPRIIPLTALDPESLPLFGHLILEGHRTQVQPLPRAIDPLRRQLMLTQLIMRRSTTHPITIIQATSLALALTRLIDEVQTERLSFDQLSRLVPDDYAHHWQVTLKFLSTLTQEWSQILAQDHALDPIDHRIKILDQYTQEWQHHPPNRPLIAAGLIGSDPSVNDLLVSIARLSNGAVILTGLDQESDDLSWQELQQDEQHPQFSLAHLVSILALSRHEIPNWIDDDCADHERISLSARRHFIAQTLLPTTSTEVWPESVSITKQALDGLRYIQCRNQEEEASIISLILRETLETPGRTAMLVTPMRHLARRVIAHLERWHIAINDSGGQPLPQTRIGNFLRLCVQCAVENCHPLPLLALAKHPLAAGGMKTGRFRLMIRTLEKYLLHDFIAQPGLNGLRTALNDRKCDHLPIDRAELMTWIDRFESLIKPFIDVIAESHTLPVLVQAHIDFAEHLATTDQERGQDRLWCHVDGKEAMDFIHALYNVGKDLDPILGSDYPKLFDSLMEQRVVRPPYGLHPRLSIYGLLEARLLHTDITILAGLNEETWPASSPADPWLSRSMRHDFGLPFPERRIGRSAHTFSQLMSHADVFLIRARQIDGVPTVPSRWLSRLITVLQAARFKDDSLPDIDQTALWSGWAKSLDEPTKVESIAPPLPTPPVLVRPRKLSVTQIKEWIENPYTIYARHILKVLPLDPISALPSQGELGRLVHSALAHFIKTYSDTLPSDDEALQYLRHCGKKAGQKIMHTDQWLFWWPWFEQVASYFLVHERDYRTQIHQHLGTEITGSMIMNGSRYGPFTISGRADRIDLLEGGSLRIIDYKTGTIPSKKSIQDGKEPQLPLLALIARDGKFSDIDQKDVRSICYWILNARGNVKPEEITSKTNGIDTILNNTNQMVEQLICKFDEQKQPYCARSSLRYPSPYEHLARVKEWSTPVINEEDE